MAGDTGAGARLVLLVTAPTVRAGLLSWPAWQTLAGASRVLAPATDHPLLPALDEAGIGWELLAGEAGGGRPVPGRPVLAAPVVGRPVVRRPVLARPIRPPWPGCSPGRWPGRPAPWCGSALLTLPAGPPG